MKLTIRKKLARSVFLGVQPPERHFPAREGRAEYRVRVRERRRGKT